jgi:hypothetical protein
MGLAAATRKLLHRLRHGDDRHLEVAQLRPVALTGVSKRPHARSQLCNSFTVSLSPEELKGRRGKAASDPADWRQCGVCQRAFAPAGSRFGAFCSVDCKSAAMYRAMYCYT